MVAALYSCFVCNASFARLMPLNSFAIKQTPVALLSKKAASTSLTLVALQQAIS